MFRRVLIANRGEIACRVIATCRRLGVGTVAVYSDADRSARHRHAADSAVHIGGARASESYLDAARVLAAARAAGADAVHPGYGFLSENVAFARACADAGIAFIGPPVAAIDAMGSKADAKRIMERAGVPCVPGYHGDDQSDATLTAEAARIGYPLLVKPTAGGGGKGMRIVRGAGALTDALTGARREAQAAFGDDRLLLERFIERPRHIEFQVFGDDHGAVVHVFERECTLQRRYQKIVEESPSPFVDDARRARMGEAAVAAARAVGYRNAGTVEFIVAPDGEFFFMEMNTRLQVEHPVTELVTGLDLVEWQLRVAAGEPLPLAQHRIARHGHAFEVRIYAEDPARGFLPASGRIRRFVHPSGDGVRVDTGVGDGDAIPPHYDPMIAKLCVHAGDRAEAVAKLRSVLDRTAVFGLTTNLPLLRAIVRQPDFATGDLDTGWVERESDALLSVAEPSADALAAAAAALDDAWRAERAAARPDDPGSPWLAARACEYAFTPRGASEPVWTTSGAPAAARQPHVVADANELLVTDGDSAWELEYRPPFAPHAAADHDAAHPGAPMPGRIVALHCKPGDAVVPGQPLLVIEAMKMEYTLAARTAGVVGKVHFGVGDMVDAEVPLVDIQEESGA